MTRASFDRLVSLVAIRPAPGGPTTPTLTLDEQHEARSLQTDLDALSVPDLYTLLRRI